MPMGSWFETMEGPWGAQQKHYEDKPLVRRVALEDTRPLLALNGFEDIQPDTSWLMFGWFPDGALRGCIGARPIFLHTPTHTVRAAWVSFLCIDSARRKQGGASDLIGKVGYVLGKHQINMFLFRHDGGLPRYPPLSLEFVYRTEGGTYTSKRSQSCRFSHWSFVYLVNWRHSGFNSNYRYKSLF